MKTQINTDSSKKGDFKLVGLTAEEIIERQQQACDSQAHLARQTLDDFDPNKVSPLNPEIISRQATINIGTIGHVAHGKSTLVRAVSGTNVSYSTHFNNSARPFVTSVRSSETLRSNSVMLMPNCSDVQLAQHQSASSLLVRRVPMM